MPQHSLCTTSYQFFFSFSVTFLALVSLFTQVPIQLTLLVYLTWQSSFDEWRKGCGVSAGILVVMPLFTPPPALCSCLTRTFLNFIYYSTNLHLYYFHLAFVCSSCKYRGTRSHLTSLTLTSVSCIHTRIHLYTYLLRASLFSNREIK